MILLQFVILLTSPTLIWSLVEEAKTCGVQYEPNNVITNTLEEVNFYTNPLFYELIPVKYIGYGFSALAPFFFANIANNTLGATTVQPGVLISNRAYDIPAGGALQATGTFSFQASLLSGTVTSPLGFDEDPFYAAGIFGLVYNGAVSWQMVFIVTNTKIYAMYTFSATTNYFRYLVPVANRLPDETDTYSVTVGSDLSVSWRLNNREVLRIFPPNRPVDPRFETGLADPSILTYPFVLPSPMRLIFGAYSLDPVVNPNDPTDIPLTACQRTLFNQCRQSLRNAFGSACQYVSLSNYANPPNFAMQMVFEDISVVSYTISPGCALDGNCKPNPVVCPNVKPERRHHRRPRNPVGGNETPVKPVIQQVQPQSRPVQAPNTCGCNRRS